MDTTRIPGFSAEASLYRSCARYHGSPMSELSKGEQGIIYPAMRTFCVDAGPVHMCCLVWDGGHYCWESSNSWYW